MLSAPGSYQHLEVLHILAKFMEMPTYVKHIQLALLANSKEADGGSNEQFCKIMKSMPLKLVGTFTKHPLSFCLIRSAPQGHFKADVEQFYKMLWKWANWNLFENCWNSGEIKGFVLANQRCFSLRVDPTAVCEEKKDTPMEISVSSEKSSPEMRRLLGKFTETPLLVKFFHLSTLMAIDEAKEEFRDMLGSLPVELVRSKYRKP